MNTVLYFTPYDISCFSVLFNSINVTLYLWLHDNPHPHVFSFHGWYVLNLENMLNTYTQWLTEPQYHYYRISGIFCVGKFWQKWRLEGVLNFHWVLFSLYQGLPMKTYSRVYFLLCLFLAISGRSRSKQKLNTREKHTDADADAGV